MAAPIQSKNYIREVLTAQTAAQWAASGGDYYIQPFETVRESDTGKEKTGPGLFSELPYDNPQGQTWQNTSGTPTSDDLIGYTAVTAAVTATAEWTCDDVGTEDATIIVGNKLYTVVASGATGDEIDLGANATEYADNIATKVSDDTADTLCTAENVGAVITFTANATGAAGNDIPLSTTDENITADVFADGADAVYTPKATSALALAGGNGDVSGPSSSTDNAIARFDSTTGKVIQNSVVLIADTTGVISGTKGITLSGSTSGTAALVSQAVAGTVTFTLPTDTATLGYLNIPQNSQSDDYVCVLSDAGKHILQTGASKTITIPANASVAYPIGTTLTFIPTDATGCSVAITTDTLIWADGGGTGTRTLAQYAMATAVKITTTSWLISGIGVS